MTNRYTTYRYTNAIVSPSTQHTLTTGGGGNLSLSTLTKFCHRLLHLVPPLHTTYPHHRGGGGTYLSARLLNFVIAYYILFPPSTQHTPTTGGRGRTYLSHSVYTLYTRSIYTAGTFYMHSIFIVYTQCRVYVLSLHYTHAVSRFYRHHLHVQLNVATDIHTHAQMHPHLRQIPLQHIDTQMLLLFPLHTTYPHHRGGGKLISQHAY